MSYTNADGLYVLTFGGQGVVQDKGVTTVSNRQQMVVNFADFTAIGTSFGASNIDPNDPFIPAGSVIVGATLVMTTAATSGGAATLTIGTYDAAGAAIDANGIDDAVALTAIDANGEVVRCDGAQAAGSLGYVTVNAYVGAIYATAAYTAGAAKLIIEFIQLT